MKIRQPLLPAIIMMAFAACYAVAFWIMVSVDANSAQSRYDKLISQGSFGSAIGHGEQLIALRIQDGADPESLVPIKRTLAKAHLKSGKPARAVELLGEVLASKQASKMSLVERENMRALMAANNLKLGNLGPASAILAGFLDSAGDAAATAKVENINDLQLWYVEEVNKAMDSFVDILSPVQIRDAVEGTETEKLAAAHNMTLLGGYYAGLSEGTYAAAGLLSAAYRMRLEILGAADKSTLQTALILGPVYQKIGREKDAEKIYLDAFHAQEQAKGSNNPELSLYMRLLSEVYKSQGRYTEAESLNNHIRSLFRDAFGKRRYQANKSRDRRSDINRPVSLAFPLDGKYKPKDLVKAQNYEVALSKPPTVEEMSLRLAKEADHQGQETLPSQLNKLFSKCSESKSEKLSLRSGYRSYKTQVWLYNETDHHGKVTKPGTSEHQLGLAVDVDVNSRLMRRTDRAYQCFEEHAWTYGFILSYPPGNTYLDGPDTYEPWHWRYVGPQTALLYREVGPLGKPQEFLSALPCYEQRAQAGVWTSADERDICLDNIAGPPKEDRLTDAQNSMSFKEGL